MDPNEKLRQQALEQIVQSIVPNDVDSSLSSIKKNRKTSKLSSEIDYSVSGISGITNNNNNNRDTNKNFFKLFDKMCEINDIITIDQKIDYLVLLKNSYLMNPNTFKDSLNINNSQQQNIRSNLNFLKIKKILLKMGKIYLSEL